MDSLAVPLELKEKGNKLFGANSLDEAASAYSKCLSILKDMGDHDEAVALRCTLLSNSAAVALKQKVHSSPVTLAIVVVTVFP